MIAALITFNILNVAQIKCVIIFVNKAIASTKRITCTFFYGEWFEGSKISTFVIHFIYLPQLSSLEGSWDDVINIYYKNMFYKICENVTFLAKFKIVAVIIDHNVLSHQYIIKIFDYICDEIKEMVFLKQNISTKYNRFEENYFVFSLILS